jgi:hypothetical protein
MDIFALLIAVLALGLAGVAFARTGGMGWLREELAAVKRVSAEALEEARRTSADAIDRIERTIRPGDTDETVSPHTDSSTQDSAPRASSE